MTFKVLKHKTLPNTFGVVTEIANEYYEVCHGTIPEMLSKEASKGSLILYWESLGQYTVVEQLNDYDLVEVELKLK